MNSRIDSSSILFPLTGVEKQAAETVVSKSPHTKIKLMPNHRMNSDSELEGFCFSAHAADKASVLPISKRFFEMTCMYECESECSGSFNGQILEIMNNMELYKQRMNDFVDDLRKNDTKPPTFNCIPTLDDTHSFTHRIVDQRVFSDSIPSTIGIFHSFASNNQRTNRTHRLFIVITNYLREAGEELYNLWLDSREKITTYDFCGCEEMHWLREATLRSNGRLASQFAERMNIPFRHVRDMADPSGKHRMIIPTTVTYHSDMRRMRTGDISLTSNACFVEHSANGVLFDAHAYDGFMLFCGPRDYASGNKYGNPFNSSLSVAFPTCTVQYHRKYPKPAGAETVLIENNEYLFTDERFLNKMQMLGYDRNDSVLNLMPLIFYEHETEVDMQSI